MPERLLFIDVETGGLDPARHSLLSVGLVVWESRKILASKEVLINDGILSATRDALSINHINLEEHRMEALSPTLALEEMMRFISRFFPPSRRITLAGHNVHFDIGFLRVFFSKHDRCFDEVFSHRIIDTSSILHYLFLAGKINKKAVSSDEAFAYFGIEVQERHTALGDAMATAELFNRLIDLIQPQP